MQVQRLAPVFTTASASAAANPIATPARGITMADIHTELGSPVEFTAKAHHGWGEPTPPAGA